MSVKNSWLQGSCFMEIYWPGVVVMMNSCPPIRRPWVTCVAQNRNPLEQHWERPTLGAQGREPCIWVCNRCRTDRKLSVILTCHLEKSICGQSSGKQCWSLASENAFPKVHRVVSSSVCQNHSLNTLQLSWGNTTKGVVFKFWSSKDLQWAVYHLSTAFKMLKLGSNKIGRVKSTTWDAVWLNFNS